MATGGAVQISRADYLTKVSPDVELANALSSIMRFEPSGFSLNEIATQVEKEALDKAKADIEKSIAQKEAEQPVNVVHDMVLEQLKTANRFTSDVNEQMAALTASFYDTMAQRLGTDAKTLYERHKLNIIHKTQSDTALNQEGFSFGLAQSTVDSGTVGKYRLFEPSS
ncbi:MAG: hypothetical protein CSA45_02750 [Gammaproteobacteria bacterium]|nr:MAG: hypothetical protein CSA45_02750 [Gammaproteobacteria bacterium]